MSDKRISELTDGGALQDTDLVPVARSGVTYRVAGSEFGGTQPVIETRTVITHAQILTLPTTAIELVAAPAADEFLLYQGGTLYKGSPFASPFDPLGWGADDVTKPSPGSQYQNVNDNGTGWAGIFYGTSPLNVPASIAIADGTDDSVYYNCFGGNGSDQLCNLVPEIYVSSSGIGFGAYAPDLRPNYGQGLYFAVRNLLGDFTDGDAANTLTVVTYHRVVALT